MSNEIQLNINLRVTNGGYLDTFAPGNVQINQAAIGAGGGVQSIGLTAALVSFGSVATNGYCAMRNLDATNFVTYGPVSGGVMIPMGKLKPGEPAVFRVAPGVAIWAQADTAACQVDVRIYND